MVRHMSAREWVRRRAAPGAQREIEYANMARRVIGPCGAIRGELAPAFQSDGVAGDKWAALCVANPCQRR